MPFDMKKNILRGMERMYNVVTGALDANTRISDTWLRGFFDDPSKYLTIKELFHQGHRSGCNIRNQALGSCFHVIQVSYAVGYTRRTPSNPEDRVSGHPLKYKSGIADGYGAVLNVVVFKLSEKATASNSTVA
ncbi:hypothetical protein MMC06_006671 [Schaereria dolodes]|nr:hypothetical protein [Schaereria dolodes]